MTRITFIIFIGLITLFTTCKKREGYEVVESADYKKAELFYGKHNDSAFYYFNKVVTTSKKSLEVAMAYNQMAVIQSDAGDYFGSQESLALSLKHLDPTNTDDHYCLASDYNELGRTSIKLDDYKSAVEYFDKALKYTTDSSFQLSILNNQGLSYQRDGAYEQALNIFISAIKNASRRKTYARILTNIATTKWKLDSTYNAVPELLRALDIRIKENDRWGLNSSYSHLADYYISSKPDSALIYAKAMLTLATELKSPDDRLEALEKLIRLSRQSTDTKRYFINFKKLSDSVETARNAAKNQFALIRYEVEKHKADNLRLQRDNKEKQYQVGGLVLAIIVIVIISLLLRRKIKLESQNKLQQTRLTFSRKVHDVVANGLYRVMNEVEHSKELDKEYLLDRLEEMYEQSRDISYEKETSDEHDFPGRISKIVMDFSTEKIRVVLVGNDENLWTDVSPEAKFEIRHVLEELMINMKKHSGANNVVIKFYKANNYLNVEYTDDGIGIYDDKPVFNNGLSSTGNRIDRLNGKITFGSVNGKGLRIKITFPLT
ncbi:tetratricopeptide repeat-containing sensor histidine kinase [Pedobacter sp. JY14-1]|uniref:tetratricopeptide repeat-containing sensor histidine kinase n=1 Tax=Pedobacter sp. JY14-1 TaxID=3034151 RepID=UPI0023E29662|nr:tetratricopeptide repeat-containing sensor histidine kinase [Pedobacter sp. JY14-1]